MEKIYDVVIIGGGPGGYTSALYCARAGLSTMVLEKLSAGGQMALTSQIDNYPGFEEGIDGFSLAEKMEQGAERFGAETELAEVLSVDFSNDIKIVESSEGTFKAKTVIIATGAVPRELGVPGEKELVGRGVGYCATCDGMFYRNKTVMVVGGGNTVVLRAVPADVEPQNAESLLVEIANKLLKGGHDALNEHTEWVLHSISCRAAIKAGDKSSPQELLALAEKILSGEVPPFCPHGRPCVLKLTRKELEKQFGRIV